MKPTDQEASDDEEQDESQFEIDPALKGDEEDDDKEEVKESPETTQTKDQDSEGE